MWVVLLAVALMAASCGDSPQSRRLIVEFKPIAAFDEGCDYRGPSSLTPGEARVSAEYSGAAASYGVDMKRIAEGHTFDELVAHYETATHIRGGPPWTTEIAFLTLDGTGRVGQPITLVEGEYALVCFELVQGEATVTAIHPVTVTNS